VTIEKEYTDNGYYFSASLDGPHTKLEISLKDYISGMKMELCGAQTIHLLWLDP